MSKTHSPFGGRSLKGIHIQNSKIDQRAHCVEVKVYVGLLLTGRAQCEASDM